MNNIPASVSDEICGVSRKILKLLFAALLILLGIMFAVNTLVPVKSVEKPSAGQPKIQQQRDKTSTEPSSDSWRI